MKQAIPDRSRLDPFAPCIDDYGVGDPNDPWANNCLARDAVAFCNGLIAREGTELTLGFDDEELQLCKHLAAEAARQMGPRCEGLYSAGDSPTSPHFVVGEALPSGSSLDANLIRSVFGDALVQEAEITVETLDERGDWWSQIENCAADSAADDPEYDVNSEIITPWLTVMQWFRDQPQLHAASMVRVHVPRHRGIRGGAVFPYFVIALTARGSLAGISTYVVKA